MARLIVEAVSGESRFVDVAGQLVLFVSVTRQDGTAVTGLKAPHFRVTAPAGSVYGLALQRVEEARWDGAATEPAGCYTLNIAFQVDARTSEKREWIEGEFYAFAIQVRFTESGNQAHSGQTVVRIESLGK